MRNLPSRLSSRGILVDSSAFYAIVAERDQWHKKAVEGFTRISGENLPVYVTNLTMAETHGLIRNRQGDVRAAQWLDTVTPLTVVFHTPADHTAVSQFLARNLGHGLSYVDAFSCVVMERIGIPRIFTFDRGFQDYGWKVFPGPI